jgi:hypothetical protein
VVSSFFSKNINNFAMEQAKEGRKLSVLEAKGGVVVLYPCQPFFSSDD